MFKNLKEEPNPTDRNQVEEDLKMINTKGKDAQIKQITVFQTKEKKSKIKSENRKDSHQKEKDNDNNSKEIKDKEDVITKGEKNNDMILSYHKEQKRYKEKSFVPPKKKSNREEETLAMWARFNNKLSSWPDPDDINEKETNDKEEDDEARKEADRKRAGQEAKRHADEVGSIRNKLKRKVDDKPTKSKKALPDEFAFDDNDDPDLRNKNEKGRENRGNTVYLRGQDNSSQKCEPASSKVFQQSTHKYREIDFDEKSKNKHQIKYEFKDRHFDENTKIKLEQSQKCSEVKLVKIEQTGEDCDSRKTSERQPGGNSREINSMKHEYSIEYSDKKSKGVQGVKPEPQGKHSGEKSKDKHENKYEHKDTKYSGVKLEKTGEDCNNLSKLNKMQEEAKSEVIENARKRKRGLKVLARRGSIKKESTNMPKTISIVNHFGHYDPPTIVRQDRPPRKRHKNDKDPTSLKESYERKAKSDEKHSNKKKFNSSLHETELSPIKFKIPKMKKPARKMKGNRWNKPANAESIIESVMNMGFVPHVIHIEPDNKDQDKIKNVVRLNSSVNAELNVKRKKLAVKKAQSKQDKIYVDKLRAVLGDDDIKAHFAQFRTIAAVEQPFDKVKKERKDFCFITCERKLEK